MENPFELLWKNLRKNLKAVSKYKDYKTYNLKSMIVKANDDLRQEVLAMQLMKRLKTIF